MIIKINMFNHNIIYNEEYVNNKCIGKCVCWGKNDNGQLGLSHLINNKILNNFDKITTRIKKIAIGGMHTIMYDIDGNIYGFGDNRFGQLGINESINVENYSMPKIILSNENIKDIICGDKFTIIHRMNGDILVTGCNDSGQLGFSDKKTRNTFTFLCNYPNIKFIKSGHGHTIIYKNNGDLIGFGNNSFGQLGFSEKYKSVAKPKKILNDETIIDVSCGNFHTMLRKKNGYIYGCGMGLMGQLGHGVLKNIFEFAPILHNNYIRQIVCGGYHTLILDKFGNVYGCGNNMLGQLGLPTKTYITVFTNICKNYGIRNIITGLTHTIFYENNGIVSSFGNNNYGQLGYVSKASSSVDAYKLMKTVNIKIFNNTVISDIYWTPQTFSSLNELHKIQIKLFLFVYNIYNQKYKQFTYSLKLIKNIIISNILTKN